MPRLNAQGREEVRQARKVLHLKPGCVQASCARREVDSAAREDAYAARMRVADSCVNIAMMRVARVTHVFIQPAQLERILGRAMQWHTGAVA